MHICRSVVIDISCKSGVVLCFIARLCGILYNVMLSRATTSFIHCYCNVCQYVKAAMCTPPPVTPHTLRRVCSGWWNGQDHVWLVAAFGNQLKWDWNGFMMTVWGFACGRSYDIAERCCQLNICCFIKSLVTECIFEHLNACSQMCVYASEWCLHTGASESDQRRTAEWNDEHF